MPLWTISKFDPKSRSEEPLGRVRASSHPKALLRAIDKYRVETDSEQRRLVARAVAKRGKESKTSPPDPEESEDARNFCVG